MTSSELKEGQDLTIHPGKTEVYATREVSTDVTKGQGEIIHTVASSETLYGLARKYDVSVGDIKKWNNLSSNSLNIGQKIIVRSGSKSTSVVSSNASSAVNSVEKEEEDKKNWMALLSRTLHGKL